MWRGAARGRRCVGVDLQSSCCIGVDLPSSCCIEVAPQSRRCVVVDLCGKRCVRRSPRQGLCWEEIAGEALCWEDACRASTVLGGNLWGQALCMLGGDFRDRRCVGRSLRQGPVSGGDRREGTVLGGYLQGKRCVGVRSAVLGVRDRGKETVSRN